MVIRSKLEHEIEHQARPVDFAYVMFPFSSQKRYQIGEFTSERCTCQQKQQTAHNFAIPYLGITSRTQSPTADRTRKLRSCKLSFKVERVT